jgi:hypothetical protein
MTSLEQQQPKRDEKRESCDGGLMVKSESFWLEAKSPPSPFDDIQASTYRKERKNMLLSLM